MKIDWMWLIIGLALGYFLLPMVMGKLGTAKKGTATTR
jgi:hypothetical protein